MKITLKKAISLLMTFVLVATLIPANAANPSAVQNAEEEVTYNATNSLGEVLSQAMDAEAEENNGYFIQDVTVDGLDAEVQISAPDGTTLVVAVYDEKSGEMITSGKAAVDSVTETAEVTLGECNMPEFFVVKAFLLDENNAPVCQNYEDLSYTEAYQEFLAKTTDDFDEDKVINLDSGKESNFAVVSDETVVIEQTLGANTIVTDDYENGIYEFENADDEMKSLEVGDVLYYVYGDGPEDYVLTKVGKIEVNGDKVTIEAADDAEISDLFSYIKIDTSKIVEEEPLSGVSYDDEAGEGDGYSEEFSEKVEKVFPENSDGTDSLYAKFSGELKVKFHLKFFYDFKWFGEDKYELSFTTTVTFNGDATIKADVKKELEPLELFHGGIPVYAGLEAEVLFTVKINIKASVEIYGGIEIKLVNGAKKVSGQEKQNLSEKPSVKLEFKVEGTATVDIIPSVSVGLKILKVFKLSLTGEAKLTVTATGIYEEEYDSGNTDKPTGLQHTCIFCVDGDLVCEITVNIKFEFGIKNKKTILDFDGLKKEINFGDFYVSFILDDNGGFKFRKFGWGECPYLEEADSDDTDTPTKPSEPETTTKPSIPEIPTNPETPTNPSDPESPNELGILDSGTCGDNLTWILYNDGELVISGTGDMYNWDDYHDETPWDSNSSYIKSITIGNGVTSIGYDAFSWCNSLTSVTIPDSVISIGHYAFIGCESITNITIPDSVTNIGADAFCGCESITSITIPDSVISIGHYAFIGCNCLTSITVDSNNKHYSSDKYGVLFNKDKTELIQYPAGNTRTSYTIPDSVTSIGYYGAAFEDCNSLTSITIPDSVTSIDDGAFSDCSSLTSIIIPDSVTTSIGVSAFYGCYSLTNVTIGNSVTSIGDYAFSWCNSLTSITIGNSVTSIGDYVFVGCNSLTDVYYLGTEEQWNKITIGSDNSPLSNATIHFENDSVVLDSGTCGDNLTWTFYNDGELIIDGTGNMNNPTGSIYVPWHNLSIKSVTIGDSVTSIGTYAFCLCKNLTSVTIGNSVTSIGVSAFYGCYSLTSITVPDSVTNIGNGAFYNCDSLTSVTIGNGVTNIGDKAFYNCDGLTSVTIPDSVTSIGEDAFYSCDSLTSVTIGNSVTSIGDEAFAYCDNFTSITIPDSVTFIGFKAFQYCGNLTDVYYTGTEEQWNKISIGSYNEDLTVANIVYNYVIPETVSLNCLSGTAVISGGSGSSKTVYNAQNGYFYTVMAVKNKSASDLLSNENLLFIDQKTAEGSTLMFDVIIPESVTDYKIIITTNAPDEPSTEEPSTEPTTKPVEVPTTTKPAETEPATKPVEVTTAQPVTEPSTVQPTTVAPTEVTTAEQTTAPVAETTTVPVTTVPTTTTPAVTEPAFTVEIRKPSQTEIKYGDSIILHADIDGNLPDGYYIDWVASNGNFDTVVSSDGSTCTVSPYASGDTVFTAIVYDADGNEVAKDEQSMTSKAGFFRKLIAFFKKIFGMTKVYPEIIKGIF